MERGSYRWRCATNLLHSGLQGMSNACNFFHCFVKAWNERFVSAIEHSGVQENVSRRCRTSATTLKGDSTESWGTFLFTCSAIYWTYVQRWIKSSLMPRKVQFTLSFVFTLYGLSGNSGDFVIKWKFDRLTVYLSHPHPFSFIFTYSICLVQGPLPWPCHDTHILWTKLQLGWDFHPGPRLRVFHFRSMQEEGTKVCALHLGRRPWKHVKDPFPPQVSFLSKSTTSLS